MSDIVIKSLTFRDMFSYGSTEHVIKFDSKLTQLVGVNGAGKSSIPTILEELFYNKNSRGVKKSSIKNRDTQSKDYRAQAVFMIGSDEYLLDKTVASTAKLKLTKNGEDISGHTATQTYEVLEALIGLDFTTFSKLTYQSMRSNLDFLIATDANRKKFLVNLLGLEKYAEYGEIVKVASSKTKLDFSSVEGTIKALAPLLNKPTLAIRALSIVPDHSAELETIASELFDLNNKINEHTAAVARYEESARLTKELLALKEPTAVAKPAAHVVNPEVKALAEQIPIWKSNLSTLSVPTTHCPTCGTSFEGAADKAEHIKSEMKKLSDKIAAATPIVQEEVLKKRAAVAEEAKYESYLKAVEAYERKKELLFAQMKVDIEAPGNIADLKAKRDELKARKLLLETEIASVTKYNLEVEIHNAKVKAEAEMQKEVQEKATSAKAAQVVLKNRLDRLDVLTKAFGTKGLIAYKIESSIKVFEELINKYLQVLSDGQFNLMFQVEDAKLALNLYNAGASVEIETLSSGEFNKVSTATLLAIRKMMTAITKVNINILFLDEVISVLDKEAKDTLIELLLTEPLNSITVSHGYTHPLADKILVRKVNGFSELVYGQ